MTDADVSASWTPHGSGVLTRACDHYGGMKTWQALRCVRLFPGRLSGLVPSIKGFGTTFSLPSAFEIEPHARRTRFVGFPDRDHVGVFDNGAVHIERRDGADVQLMSSTHRQSFTGKAKLRRWGPLDALYFFGYSLAHYHSLPFTLLQARLLRTRVTRSQTGALDVLDVELPADLPTHCRRQSFYFDQAGQLTRHDYHAEILGVWARGAHFWKLQERVAGLPIAMERQVVLRLGTTTWPLNALHATFMDAEVELDTLHPATQARS